MGLPEWNKKKRKARRREETIALAAPIARQPHNQIENVYSGLQAASA